MTPRQTAVRSLIQKPSARALLDASDIDAIERLPFQARSFDPTAYLIREGAPPGLNCSFITDGLAFRQKLTATGGRQIVSLHIAGDFLDLQQLFLRRSDHNVQALTRLQTIEINREVLRVLVLNRPNIGRAIWIDALIEASIYREWITNIGRRDARARIGHLLCEFMVRMDVAGIPRNDGYSLPMTQEQIGDAVGLTSVHVNRTLKALASEGIIVRENRHLICRDFGLLQSTCAFNPLYLHLDQTLPIDGF